MTSRTRICRCVDVGPAMQVHAVSNRSREDRSTMAASQGNHVRSFTLQRLQHSWQ
jgi:hypothetical protein